MTTAYCVLSDVKSALGIQTTKDDLWISSSLIPQAQALLDSKIGYSFQQEGTVASPVVKLFNGNDRTLLFLPPILSFSQVTQSYSAFYVTTDGYYVSQVPTTQDITADCYLSPANELPAYQLGRKSGMEFSPGRQNISITGVWGFPSVPADITRACIRLAVHFYKMRDTNYADVLAEQGSIRQKYTKHLPDDVQDIIDDWRRRRFYSGIDNN